METEHKSPTKLPHAVSKFVVKKLQVSPQIPFQLYGEVVNKQFNGPWTMFILNDLINSISAVICVICSYLYS